jgi:hypothetical protein
MTDAPTTDAPPADPPPATAPLPAAPPVGARLAGGPPAGAPLARAASPVVELRQYTLRPGQRDVLIELFDRELVETQEAVGMQIIGQFRDLADPDRFVWLRGFTGMDSRLAALTAFYGGPVWAAHRAAANATMLDVDDVLLLRPAGPGAGFARPPRADGASDAVLTATVYPVAGTGDEEKLLDFLHSRADPVLADAGRRPIAELRTKTAVNTFPALPIREGEHAVVRFAAYAGAAEHAGYVQRLRQSPRWQEVRADLPGHLTGPPQRLRLQPTHRSRLR